MWHSFLIIILIDFKNLASDIFADKFGRLQEKIGTECPGGEIAKGQLISKCPFSVIVSTKIPTKKFDNFCPRI